MKGWGILGQVAGLALAAIVAVLAAGALMILTIPVRELPGMTVQEVVAALSGRGPPGLHRAAALALPEGRPSPLLRASLSGATGIPPADVRAVWLETPTAPDPRPAAQAVTLLAGQEAVVEARAGGFVLASGAGAVLHPDTPVPAFAAAIRGADGGWTTVSPRAGLFSPWRLRLLAAFLLSAAVLAPLVLVVAQRLTRPVRDLALAAERLGLAPGGAGAPISGPREIRAAAGALNAMRDRLAAEVGGRERMLAAIAHDLRTPLTGLRLRVENAAEPERARMVADLDRMGAMIARLLDYVRGRQSSPPFSRQEAGTLVRAWLAARPPGEGPVEAGPIASAASIACAPDDLRRAFDNLVDNALRFAGAAAITVEASDGWVDIMVADEGPGIAAEEIGRLMEPFERLDGSRSVATGGVGLGLAIAGDIARAHGGALLLAPRRPVGLAATLRLPAAGPVSRAAARR